MTKGAKGRCSSATTERPLRGDISHIRVIGREERTNAEQAQYRLLLRSLTAARSPPPFVNIIWFPRNTKGIKGNREPNLLWQQSSQILKDLNDSQKGIVCAMVSVTPQDSLVIAHGIYICLQRSFIHRRRCDYIGPPGTGKTTTIAAAAATWVSYKLPCWIVAQSNVGVKN